MIQFIKMNGAGNDFLVADNRQGGFPHDPGFIRQLCTRRTGVGADGLLLVESPREGGDFRMRYFNADGGEAEMCGNGARCISRFAHQIGAAPEQMTIETMAGMVQAKILEAGQVDLTLSDPSPVEWGIELSFAGSPTIMVDWVDTGVPHAVAIIEDLEQIDVEGLGRAIRTHDRFSPAGTNVDFMALLPDRQGIDVRTYERGVEGETLACGTGIAASALIASLRLGLSSPVKVRARSGDQLEVRFGSDHADASGPGRFTQVHLVGPAEFVYQAELMLRM